MEITRDIRRGIVTAAALASLAAAGCADHSEKDNARRWNVGDTIVVENHSPIPSTPATLVPVARYGSRDALGPESLFEVHGLAVAPDGSVILYDNRAGIKRFDPNGEFSGWVVRAGAGPREVGYTPSLAVDADGEIAALDQRNRRLLIIEPDGDSQSVRLPDLRHRYHEDALHYTSDGRLMVGVNPSFTSDRTDTTPQLAYLGLTNGAFSDSVFVPSDIWERCPMRSERQFRVGFWEDGRVPYMPKATWALAPNGTFALGCPDEYEFDIHKPDGSVLRVRRTGVEPVALTDEQQEFLAQWADLPGMPDERPAYARLILPGDGRIWVWPNRPMEKWVPSYEIQRNTGESVAWRLATSGSFDVFRADGTWVGTVPLPEEIDYSGFPTENTVVIRGDTLWAVTRDSMGVNYVTRYAVRWE